MQKGPQRLSTTEEVYTYSENRRPVSMKRRTLAGTCGIGVFAIALITVVLAFATPSWLVSDYRITGSKLERLGLWVHCFRSLPDVNDDSQRRFFVGCRWVFDPFTKGYNEIRGFLLPSFVIVTQFFYTLCFIGTLMTAVMVLIFGLCAGPDQKHFIHLIKAIGFCLLAAGSSGCIGVLVFAIFGNRNGWMPEHANNWFGWSFVVGIIGAVMTIVASILFLVEANVQEKKRKQFKESQTRFELVRGGNA
ncbi:uncharacterized protein LOC129946801 [Eupeodes corollae]|uniref:uncharacterized protein LOC129946801 n=1 Tax=Eupeodes corollae TaxID=290404 RepID=UPI0024904313|nr:uncharacterized protein LOC129946801 [Eupeodes corollae]